MDVVDPPLGWWIVRRRDGVWTAFRDRDVAVLLTSLTLTKDSLPRWSATLPNA